MQAQSASGHPPARPAPSRVLQTIRQGYVGGGESHVLSLVSHLDRSRYNPQVLSFTPGQMVESLHQMDVPVHVIPTRQAFDLRVLGSVKQLLRDEKINLVHVHGSRAAANLIWASRSLKIPVVYTIHGWSFHDDQSALTRWLRIRSEQYLTARSTFNISVSASNQQTGQQHMPRFSSVVIPNGIDLARFNTKGLYRDIRSELGIPEDHTLVSFIARMTAQKDPLTLIRAFREVCNQSEGISLLVVGEGELKAAAMDLVSSLDLGNRIFFQDFRSDVPDILHASDIYCLPSLWEGLPIGLLEAMAMGNAAVATRVDGTKEIIRHGENGWLFEPEDEQALSNALLTLHRDTVLRGVLQKKATATIAGQFDVLSMTRRVEEVYEKALAKSR